VFKNYFTTEFNEFFGAQVIDIVLKYSILDRVLEYSDSNYRWMSATHCFDARSDWSTVGLQFGKVSSTKVDNICRWRSKKTRVMELAGRTRSLTISSAVWMQSTNATDRPTDEQTE